MTRRILTPEAEALSTDPRVEAFRLAVGRLARRIRRNSGAMLSPAQMSALATLERRGRIRTGRLAELEGIGKSSATRLTARLEELGLVDRTPDASDGRSWQVELSDSGRSLLASSSAHADAYLARQIAALPPDEQATLLGALPSLECLLAMKA